MSQQQIQKVTRALAKVDGRDTLAQAALLGDVALLRDQLQREGRSAQAQVAEAATQLLQYLTQLGCIGPEGILKVVGTLMSGLSQTPQAALGSGVAPEGELEFEPGAERVDGTDSIRAGAERLASERASATAISLESATWRNLDLSNSSMDLRMVSDCLLGEVMIQMKLIERSDLQRALAVQGATGMRIGEALVDVGAATWDQIKAALARQEDQKQR